MASSNHGDKGTSNQGAIPINRRPSPSKCEYLRRSSAMVGAVSTGIVALSVPAAKWDREQLGQTSHQDAAA